MGASRKFKDDYPSDETSHKNKNAEDKLAIQTYLNKISKLLEDPQNQKKAADLLEKMINKKK